MKVNYVLLGLRIKENRQLKNLTQEELAELLYVAYNRDESEIFNLIMVQIIDNFRKN